VRKAQPLERLSLKKFSDQEMVIALGWYSGLGSLEGSRFFGLTRKFNFTIRLIHSFVAPTVPLNCEIGKHLYEPPAGFAFSNELQLLFDFLVIRFLGLVSKT